MKRSLVLIVAAIAINLSASAQEKQELKQYKKDVYKSHHKGKAHDRKEMMKNLNLTEDQKKQLKTNHEEFKTKMQALDKEQNITVKEMRERKAALMKEQKTKNETIFTPEQKEKMAQEKIKRENEEKLRAEKRLDHMKTTLSLTDDQVAKLKTQNEENRAKMKAIKENESLDRTAKKEQMMALKNNAKEQRKTILTADQLKKLEESKKEKTRESKKSKR